MNHGPVEYLVIGFPGNRLSSELVSALAAVGAAGSIRILDLVVVTKGADGGIEAVQIDNLPEDLRGLFEGLQAEDGGLVTAADIALVAEDLERSSTAALLIWENVWLTELAGAILNAGGQVLMDQRLPPDVVARALAGLVDSWR
jgi:hypothetical protein